MICPRCKKYKTSIVSDNYNKKTNTVERKRRCSCGNLFSTFEKFASSRNKRKARADTVWKDIRFMYYGNQRITVAITTIWRALNKIYNLKIASSRLAGNEPFENPKVIDIVRKTRFAFYTINGKPYLSIKKFNSKKEYKFKIQSKKKTIIHLLKKTMYWAHRELIFGDDVWISKPHLKAVKILLEPGAYKKQVVTSAEHELIKEAKSLLLRKEKQLKLEKNMFDKDIVEKKQMSFISLCAVTSKINDIIKNFLLRIIQILDIGKKIFGGIYSQKYDNKKTFVEVSKNIISVYFFKAGIIFVIRFYVYKSKNK